MNKYRLVSKENLPEDEFWDDGAISFLIIFCDTLFPGAEFKYVRTRRGKHELVYHPEQGTSHKALWIYLNVNLIDFEVFEYNDAIHSHVWNGYNSVLKYNKLLPYNIYKAYQALEDCGLIEHYIVDEIINKPTAVLPKVASV